MYKLTQLYDEPAKKITAVEFLFLFYFVSALWLVHRDKSQLVTIIHINFLNLRPDTVRFQFQSSYFVYGRLTLSILSSHACAFLSCIFFVPLLCCFLITFSSGISPAETPEPPKRIPGSKPYASDPSPGTPSDYTFDPSSSNLGDRCPYNIVTLQLHTV